MAKAFLPVTDRNKYMVEIGGQTESSPAKPGLPVEPTYTAPTAPSSGSGGGSGGGASAAPTVSTERTLVGALGNWDPATDAAYQSALQALETARGQLPEYTDNYSDQLSALYAQITGREPFRYDLDSDPLYQQYRDQYTQQGQQAMMNAMGQAAALTGGYGSTYSQAVGQQQYNAYLQDLNAVVPSLYQNAYSRWQDEGDRILNQYGIVSDLADTEYGRYRDQMSDYWTGVNYAQAQEQLAYNRGLDAWEREYQLNEDKRAQQESDYDRLMQLMQIGYAPNADEIKAAGMSEAEAAAWQNYIKSQQASGYSGGGSGSVALSGYGEQWLATMLASQSPVSEQQVAEKLLYQESQGRISPEEADYLFEEYYRRKG